MASWVRTSFLLFLVAAASAEIAIALTTVGSNTPQAVTTQRTTTQLAPTTTQQQQPPPPPTSSTTKTTPVAPPNGRTKWPQTRSGWTVILASYPEPSGRTGAQALASRAAAAGLSEVGVLRSSDFASLRAGYYAVFSGMYASEPDAQAALTTARMHGYADAYPRRVSS